METEGNDLSLTAIVSEAVHLKLLKPDVEFDRLSDITDEAINHAGNPGLAEYESSWGDYVQVYVQDTGYSVTIYGQCHQWRMRMKPILETLTDPGWQAWACQVVNHSVVQGPWYWEDILATLTGDDEEEAEKEGGWFSQFKVKYPFWKSMGKPGEPPTHKQTLLKVFTGWSSAEEKELVKLLIELRDADEASDKYEGYSGLMSATWDRNCSVNHAHDFLVDNDEGDDSKTYEFTADSLLELKEAFAVIGRAIAAATALEQWTNRKTV